jgi:hypothetical protein
MVQNLLRLIVKFKHSTFSTASFDRYQNNHEKDQPLYVFSMACIFAIDTPT